MATDKHGKTHCDECGDSTDGSDFCSQRCAREYAAATGKPIPCFQCGEDNYDTRYKLCEECRSKSRHRRRKSIGAEEPRKKPEKSSDFLSEHEFFRD